MKLSAVIPVYNEEEVIDEFCARLVNSLEKMKHDYEVIFIVEGDDATFAKLDTISEENSRVRADYYEKRLGLGKAMRKGLGLVSPDAEYVLTMDADLNHDPEDIRRLLERTREADVVIGARSKNYGMVDQLPLFKRVVSGATNWLLRNIFNMSSSDVTSGFRVYSARVVESIRRELVSTDFEVTAELLIRAEKKGFTIYEVPINFTLRPRGKSKLSFLRSGLGYAKLLVRLTV